VIRQLTAFAALLTIACGPDITTNRDASIPLPKAASWMWGPRDTIHQYELDPAAQNPLVHQRVREAIEATLAKKGWKQATDPAQAQLVVTYHVGLKRTTEIQATSTGVGGGWANYGWGYYGAPMYSSSTIRPVEYSQGALLILVHDAAGKVAWQGLFKKEVQDPNKVSPEKIQRAVDGLLAELK
jgi:hypothetical protein